MSIPERGHIIAVSVLSDGNLSNQVLETYNCEKPGEPEVFTMEPHMYGQRVVSGIGISDKFWCQNLSGPQKKLCQLTSGTYLNAWVELPQQVTIVSLGSVDLIQGVIDVNDLINNPYVWVECILHYVDHLVGVKLAFYRRLGFFNVAEEWALKHSWYIYPIPQLPMYRVEECGKINIEDYNKVRRLIKKVLKIPRNIALLRGRNVFLMKDNVDVDLATTVQHPDWREDAAYKQLYAAPIVRHLANIHCLRCKASLLHKAGWQSCVFRKGAGEGAMRLNWLVDSDWVLILQYISVFDIFAARLTCKAFYAKVHQCYRCTTALNVQVEQSKLEKKS